MIVFMLIATIIGIAFFLFIGYMIYIFGLLIYGTLKKKEVDKAKMSV